ncbi:MAG: hypothetical protein ACPG5P_02125, partial [Saprospiraceae bacterium]
MAKKADKREKDRRVRYVAHWLMLGHSHADITDNAANTWGIGKRQGRKYIVAAQSLFLEENKDDLNTKLAWHQNARRERYRKLIERQLKVERSNMESRDKHATLATLDKTINSLLTDMAKLDGLYVKRVELTGKGGKDLIPQTKEE